VILYHPDQLNDQQLNNIFGMNTKKSLIEEEKGKLSGDLNMLLFFLATNLMDIETEVEEIYRFHQSYLTGGYKEIVIDFKGEEERREKSIYRLALLGIVEDWTVNWKSRQFEVELTDCTEATVIDKLTKHIQKYDYNFTLDPSEQQSEQYHDVTEHFHHSNEPFLKRILFVLLKWYNDNVIYSRKRSMLLMKQSADEFTDSQALHQKIEDYFKRNDDVYLLEKNVAQKDRLIDWYKIFYVEEEGKASQPRAISSFKSLRITVGRFLESYQNDISLNLINGLICLAADDFESIDGRERMSMAIREVSRFDIDERDEMLNSILVTAGDFLTTDQKQQLSETLISNGFDLMEDLKQIHVSLSDRFSYGNMIKTLHSTIREQSYGGYPWEI
jgi:ATP-dependent DNA helicase RecQ